MRCHRNLDFCSVAVWFLKTILARAKAEVLRAGRGETESVYLGSYCKTPAQPSTLPSSCSRANDRAMYPCRGGGARPSGCVVAPMKYSHLGLFSVGHWGPVTSHCCTVHPSPVLGVSLQSPAQAWARVGRKTEKRGRSSGP